MSRIVILGGGIAGLSAAMELIEDHEVLVIERRDIAGGKARTWTDPDYEVFREHSFRVFHDTYHNTFDTMRRVRTGPGRTIRDNLEGFVSKEDIDATGEDLFRRWVRSYLGDGSVPWPERVRLARDAGRLLKAMCSSDDRLRARYSSSTFEEIFIERADGSRGLIFQGLKDMSQVEYSADRINPDVKIMINFIEKHFLQGVLGLGWNALKGPTSDTFIEPWRRHLADLGVEFRFGTEVVSIDHDDRRHHITSVTVRAADTPADTPADTDVETITGDCFISAMPTDALLELATKDLLIAAPTIARLGEVRRVWNNGVIIYTSVKTKFLGGYYMWHPWRVALTTYADRWSGEFDITGYGVGEVKGTIKDIISYVITDWHAPGLKVKKKASDCTPDEIYDELCWMCLEDPSILPEFDPAVHVYPVDADGHAVTCLVDGSLIYDAASGRIIVNEDTLAHLPPGGSFRMPGATTEIPNLFLAGCHCYNAFGCGDSMEGANETGRRAANAVLEAERSRRRVTIHEGRTKSKPVRVLEALRRIDRRVFGLTKR